MMEVNSTLLTIDGYHMTIKIRSKLQKSRSLYPTLEFTFFYKLNFPVLLIGFVIKLFQIETHCFKLKSQNMRVYRVRQKCLLYFVN
jgi:hypothetical protein